MVIAVAVAALLLVIGGSYFLINDGPTPAQLAAAENSSTTEYVPPELGAWYCRNPAPRPDAPEPVDGSNQFVVFEHANGERTASPLDVFATDQPSQAAYALCLTGVEDGEDVECVGYTNNESIRFEGMDWTAELIQLSTGESVFSSEVLRGPDPDCPLRVDERVGLIRADVESLRYATVAWALPDSYSETHLGNTLNGNDGSWCRGATPLPELGSARVPIVPPTVPPVEGEEAGEPPEAIQPPPAVYVSAWPSARATVNDMVAVSSLEPDSISHVACVVSDWPSGRRWQRCDYNSFVLAFRPFTYRVTVVDVVTGEAVASENFEGGTSCPDSVFSDTTTEIRDAVVPDALGTFIESAVGYEAPVLDEEE